MFLDHNGMKLEINNRSKFGIFTNMRKLNNTLLITSVSKNKSQRKLEESLR